MSHMAKKSTSDSAGSLPRKDGHGDHDRPLPILEGAHSLAHDMKFGYQITFFIVKFLYSWKPDLSFDSAPIPLYFNFVDQPLVQYY